MVINYEADMKQDREKTKFYIYLPVSMLCMEVSLETSECFNPVLMLNWEFLNECGIIIAAM